MKLGGIICHPYELESVKAVLQPGETIVPNHIAEQLCLVMHPEEGKARGIADGQIICGVRHIYSKEIPVSDPLFSIVMKENRPVLQFDTPEQLVGTIYELVESHGVDREKFLEEVETWFVKQS